MEYYISEEAREVHELPMNKFKFLSLMKAYNFLDNYVANEYGDVYRVKGINGNTILGCIVKPYINRDSYIEFILIDKFGKPKHMLQHRIVACLYIPQPVGYNYVNHKDGNRQNNHVSNLEWVQHSENIKHSWRKLRTDNNSNRYKRRLPGEEPTVTYRRDQEG